MVSFGKVAVGALAALLGSGFPYQSEPPTTGHYLAAYYAKKAPREVILLSVEGATQPTFKTFECFDYDRGTAPDECAYSH